MNLVAATSLKHLLDHEVVFCRQVSAMQYEAVVFGKCSKCVKYTTQRNALVYAINTTVFCTSPFVDIHDSSSALKLEPKISLAVIDPCLTRCVLVRDAGDFDMAAGTWFTFALALWDKRSDAELLYVSKTAEFFRSMISMHGFSPPAESNSRAAISAIKLKLEAFYADLLRGRSLCRQHD